MARRYLVRPLPAAGERTLAGEVAHHVGRVLRARPGDRLALFDGAGLEADAWVVRVDRHALVVTVGEARAVDREPHVRIEVAFAVPKGSRADWLFEHGTEVGIAGFRPLVTARAAREPRSTARFQRIVAAATGQCDRSRLPQIHEPATLDEFLRDPSLPTARFAAAPGAVTELGPATAKAAVIAIGPEGGLTDAELAELEAAGFGFRGLGPLTLRVETAALVAAVRLLSPDHGSSGCSHSSANEK